MELSSGLLLFFFVIRLCVCVCVSRRWNEILTIVTSICVFEINDQYNNTIVIDNRLIARIVNFQTLLAISRDNIIIFIYRIIPIIIFPVLKIVAYTKRKLPPPPKHLITPVSSCLSTKSSIVFVFDLTQNCQYTITLFRI